MTNDAELVEVWRGDRIECVHRGHAVVCNDKGETIATWGDPLHVTYPRSSAKMIQALPLVETGAAESLTSAQLALACASHIATDCRSSEYNRRATRPHNVSFTSAGVIIRKGYTFENHWMSASLGDDAAFIVVKDRFEDVDVAIV